MGRLQDNTQYLSINGQTITAEFISAGVSKSNSSVETTSGSGATDTMRGRGLSSYSFRASIAYLTESVDDILLAIGDDDIIVIEFGPESNVAGKPRHVQTFNVTSIEGPEKTVEKGAVEFSLQAESTAAPSVNMYAGGVYTA